MTDQGNDPTRPIPATGDDPTQAMPPVPPTPPGPPVEPPLVVSGGEPPDRRPWIIAGLLGLVALIAIILLIVGNNNDDDADDETADPTTTVAPSTTTTSEATTTTVEITTTTEAVTTTAPPVTESPPVTADPAQCAEAGADPADPGPAALAVYQAWERGDEACASELMTDDARADLFEREGAGATDQFQGCTEQSDPDPHMDCAFTYPGGSTHFRFVYSATDGWQVVEVYQVAD